MTAIEEAKFIRATPLCHCSPAKLLSVIDDLLKVIEPPKPVSTESPMWQHKCHEFDGLIACGESCNWCGTAEAVDVVDGKGRN